jgi:uncharacterized iron-regulated membrane protein
MRVLSVRRGWVLVHRYVGLTLAAFLILEGVTGSILAFKTPIGEWLAPETFATPHVGPPLDLATLAVRAEAQEPKARVGFFSVDGRQAAFSMLPRTDPAIGRPFELDFDHLILDPWTGRELARQRNGDLSQGAINIVPFIYNLHQNLAVGGWGTILLGIVAVLWTIDCFVAVCLTLPTSWTRFIGRWQAAWVIKWPFVSAFRLNFDLHRATGLWLWPVLFVFAWSSVMFTLPDQVYQPVTKALMDYQTDADTFAAMNRRPQRSAPKLGWAQAQSLGRRYMLGSARRFGYSIIRPYGMAYIPGWNVYTYAVVSRASVQAHGWETSLWVDGDTGQLVGLDVTATERVGNKLDTWLRALHFGDLGDSVLYRAFVCAVGIVTSMLSVTGVYIWWKKRAARKRARDRRAGSRRATPHPILTGISS